jgi:hypothetical protein
MTTIEKVGEILCFIKRYDIPNWFALLFTGIAWPLVLFLWNTRKIQNIPY